ncbi:MAG TPA: methylenetetrahydrofolate reductase [NAD(P)H] [Opitutae bacterium]|nr:methylenetetrahydrofolate reductase [NAD(P)H] [Opitutae bacterium]|tara:strand:+ start:11811 stop:12686 length:876 start_codon:yes stop_codon:yes gene_type:complete
MAKGKSIREFLEAGKPLFSVEFFPPQDEAGGERILATAKSLTPHQPDFVSITYGAGGGTRATTMRYARILREEHGFEVMPHLTCVGHTRDELLEILDDFAEAGFCNVMALRGDPPKGETEFKAVPGGLRYGSDLVALVRERFPHFGIGVGGYPEKHPEAPDMATDLSHLKTKVDAGADFITTQLFFDNRDYLAFVASCRKSGIEIPVLPGLLPVLSLGQVKRFCDMCGTSIPGGLRRKLEAEDKKDQPEIGARWALEQVRGLLREGAPGFHLYALNQSASTLAILEGLKGD